MFKRHRSRDNRGVICPLILILISVKKLGRSDFGRLARGTIQLLRNVPLLATIVNQNGNRGGLYIRVSIPVFVAILSFILPIRSILLRV